MEGKRIELGKLAPENAKYQNDGDPRTSGPGFAVTTHPAALTVPLARRTPTTWFVNSMSDLFHKDIPDEYIAQVFAVMAATPQHTYQVLTKRHGRMRSLLRNDEFRRLTKLMHAEMQLAKVLPYRPLVINAWPLRNVWLGVSVENQQWANIRIPALLATPTARRFLSCEPLLAPVDLGEWLRCEDGTHRIPLDWLHLVIIGGESGDGARPMHIDWARRLRDDCTAARVPVHFKQLGTHLAHELGIIGKGDKFEDLPAEFQIRQHPAGVA
jgi:protein gp37